MIQLPRARCGRTTHSTRDGHRLGEFSACVFFCQNTLWHQWGSEAIPVFEVGVGGGWVSQGQRNKASPLTIRNKLLPTMEPCSSQKQIEESKYESAFNCAKWEGMSGQVSWNFRIVKKRNSAPYNFWVWRLT